MPLVTMHNKYNIAHVFNILLIYVYISHIQYMVKDIHVKHIFWRVRGHYFWYTIMYTLVH